MRICDKDFFTEYISGGICGGKIKEAALCGDLALCRRSFAAYVKGLLAETKDRFFETLAFHDDDRPESDEALIALAEKACRHIVVSCGREYDFGKNGKNGKIDWEYNPTENGYPEWPWQLNRHDELLCLARAYRRFADKKYLDAFCEMLSSWLDSEICPEIGVSGYATVAWRTIECGIRMGSVWPEMIFSVFEGLPDGLLCDCMISVCEHALRLFNDHVETGNWLIMEMNGLFHISVLFPFFSDAEKWRALAESIFAENLDAQIYPDGSQYELTTSYQYVVISNYIRPIRLCRAFGQKVPERFIDTLKNAVLYYRRIVMPDGRCPSINDGMFLDVERTVLHSFEDIFDRDEREELYKTPDTLSHVFEYGGNCVFRTGYEKNDVYLLFDAGPLGISHSHEDKLSVLLFSGGRLILCEGNNYAYDRSPMREYVLSTRSHNTALVDGLPQNRRESFRWERDEINKKAGIEYKLGGNVEFARAVYDEGYGPGGKVKARHERSVYFVKNTGNEKIGTFAVVIDRFFSDVKHTYELLWHVDDENITLRGGNAYFDGLDILVPDDTEKNFCIEISRGKTSPEYQGFTADRAVQGAFRPVYCVSRRTEDINVRCVTVLFPHDGENDRVEKVIAGSAVTDKNVTLLFSDSFSFSLSE